LVAINSKAPAALVLQQGAFYDCALKIPWVVGCGATYSIGSRHCQDKNGRELLTLVA
jgi:hypothetical protein